MSSVYSRLSVLGRGSCSGLLAKMGGAVRLSSSLKAPSTILPDSSSPEPRHGTKLAMERRRLVLRTGIVGRKVGMSALYNEETGERTAVTIVEFNGAEVTNVRTPKDSGFYGVEVGVGSKSPYSTPKQALGHFARAGVNPKANVKLFIVKDKTGLLPLGTKLGADFFKVGQFVDVKGVSRGKGFQGVMKRHGFGGMRASHGTSLTHRHGGSYGQNQTPGRVLPGKKMPGRMGGKNATEQNCQVMQVDVDNNYILLKGAIPGAKGSYVKVQDALRKYTGSMPEEAVEETKLRLESEAKRKEMRAKRIAEKRLKQKQEIEKEIQEQKEALERQQKESQAASEETK